MSNIFIRFINFFRGFDDESVCVADKLADVLKDVNTEAYRSELQKESGIYCREKFGEHGIDITPDILFKNRRRAVRFARRYGNRHRKSNTKSTMKQGGAKNNTRKLSAKAGKAAKAAKGNRRSRKINKKAKVKNSI